MDKRCGFVWAVAVISLSLQACNSDESKQQLPPGAKIQMFPEEITWEIIPSLDEQGRCLFRDDIYNDTTVQFTITNTDGVPLGGIDVGVLADLTEQTFSGHPVIKLFDDKNGNGVADPDEYVSDGVSSEFITRTDRFSGTARVIVRANLSCEYRGNLYVSASSAAEAISVEVKALEDPL